ncbi:hypothetical protein PanWU01x14_160550 [Parasponia andersonii]|uniref:Uncharacterized protein n=1 Tax=Parasponia andersonii TaxID=3476 RepID=A0A2P5CE30_PARAD|nr:hypothetical protein PanWU01x14_160550 [Parasponia andersonii]
MARENVRRGMGWAIKYLPADLIKNHTAGITSLVDDPRGCTKSKRPCSKKVAADPQGIPTDVEELSNKTLPREYLS